MTSLHTYPPYPQTNVFRFMPLPIIPITLTYYSYKSNGLDEGLMKVRAVPILNELTGIKAPYWVIVWELTFGLAIGWKLSQIPIL